MDPDATFPLPPQDEQPKDVFRIGEETILKMQDQVFSLDDYGTRMGDAGQAAAPGVTAAQEAVSGDPLARIEQKLDHAIEVLESLHRRVDSLDATIAHLIAR